MYDLHCHMLPGIDDGARNMDEALSMAELAVADGVHGVVLTPHVHPGRWENTHATISAALDGLHAALAANQIPLSVAYAAEVRLSDDILVMVSQNTLPFYGDIEGYRVMLLEFPHGHIVPGSDKLVKWLMAKKIRPMIAHPERNKAVMRAPEAILPFVELGCWLQVTANSVVGGFGAPAAKTASWLFERDLVSVIASDAHNRKYRSPQMSRAYAHISDKFGVDRAQRLFHDLPKQVFESAHETKIQYG